MSLNDVIGYVSDTSSLISFTKDWLKLFQCVGSVHLPVSIISVCKLFIDGQLSDVITESTVITENILTIGSDVITENDVIIETDPKNVQNHTNTLKTTDIITESNIILENTEINIKSDVITASVITESDIITGRDVITESHIHKCFKTYFVFRILQTSNNQANI
jgi:hypothetical protein